MPIGSASFNNGIFAFKTPFRVSMIKSAYLKTTSSPTLITIAEISAAFDHLVPQIAVDNQPMNVPDSTEATSSMV